MTANLLKSLGVGIASLLFAAGAGNCAWANGGDFFAELSTSWGDPAAGTPFFGWVRDIHGKPLSEAEVTATSPADPTGTYREQVTVVSDRNGHFRIPGFGLGVTAKDIVIECTKAHYIVIAHDRRALRSRPDAPVEVDFKMDVAR